MHQQATQTTAAVTAVLHAIGGDGPLGPGVLAANPIVSIADSDHGLPPRALVTRDAGEAARTLGALALGPATPVIAVTDGAVTFVEACTAGSGVASPGSLILTATHDAAGRIARLVVLTGAGVDPPSVDPPSTDPVDHDGAWPEIAPLLDRYFADLEASDFEAAVGWFSPDCLYSHPPYSVDDARVDFRGRDALLDGFVHKRGKTSSRHGLLRVVQDGRHGFVEGFAAANHISDGSTFLSSVSLDGEGRIERYVAYYAAPQVPDA